MTDDEPSEETLDLIKLALKKPMPIFRDEAIEFITKPVCIMNADDRIVSTSRGPKPKKTYGDRSYELRKGLYHKWVRLPQAGAVGRLEVGDSTLAIIKEAADKESANGVERKDLINAIQEQLNDSFNDSTVRRALKKLGY